MMTSTQQSALGIRDENTNAARLRDIERLYVEVRRDIMAGAPPAFARDMGMCEFSCEDGLGVALKNIASVQFNRWVGIGVARPATEQAIDRAIDWMTVHASSTWGLEITPAALPADLVARIEARGFRMAPGGFATFQRDARPLEDTLESQFTLRRVGVEDADLFGAHGSNRLCNAG
ncbi:MAG: hypothetical protein WDN30_09720 [Pararobbsia sp.]